MDNNNPLFNLLSPSSAQGGMTDEELALIERRRAVRVVSVVLVVLCTLFLAVMAGAMIALWDTGKSSRDLIAVLNGSYVYAQTQEELDRIASGGEAVAEAENGTGQPEESQDDEGLSVVNEVPSDDADSSDGDISDMSSQDNSESGIDVVEDAGSEDDASMMNGPKINVYVDPNVNYPIPFSEVDESYFEDALFIGDSRLQGFGMYSGMPGTFYAATGFQLYKYDSMDVVTTDEGKVPITQAMPYDSFTKIYIKVGLNEMGGNDNIFLSRYKELITWLRGCQPRAIIYIHGLLPVTAAKSQSDKVHNNTNVNARNESLKQLAMEQRAYYLDVGSALAGADGSLPAEMAADGIHLKAQYMDIWKQYLMSHAVVVE
ncbi:MAG: hypothetical protein IKT17_10135 [Lachnospiraceae bacterium]|nr:hypothetical protein [Lachnospiraceae bacterium]